MDSVWWLNLNKSKEKIDKQNKNDETDPCLLEKIEEQRVNENEDEVIRVLENVLVEMKKGVERSEEKIVNGNEFLDLLKEGIECYERIKDGEENNGFLLKEVTNDAIGKIIFVEETKYKRDVQQIEMNCRDLINKRKEEFEQRKVKLEQMKYKIPKRTGVIPMKFRKDKELKVIGESFDYLQDWSNLNECQIVFDSSVDSCGIFNQRIMNKPNLYFVNYDEFGNVFGAFISSPICITDKFVVDNNHFIFSLKKGDLKPKKWNPIGDNTSNAILLYENESYLYQIGQTGCFVIHQVGISNSYCKNLQIAYSEAPTSLTNTPNFEDFSVNRIVVIQML